MDVDLHKDNNEDAAAQQLLMYSKQNQNQGAIARRSDGIPYESLRATLTCGAHGPPLLQDTECLSILQNFVRRRHPLRTVHGKGFGAHGVFKVTNPDIAKYTKASLFQPGVTTRLFGRFGLGFQENRNDGGRFFVTMSIKFYTKDGNYDLLCLNHPAFTFREPFLFALENQAEFENPQTQGQFTEHSSFWDFVCNRPEAVHRFIFHYSDRGIPAGIRYTNQFPINIFKFVNAKGDFVYGRYHFRTDQGSKYLTEKQAAEFRKNDADFAMRDMYNAIEQKDFPSWTLYLQIMPKDEPPKYRKRTGWNPFDVTKLWPQADFPLIEVGKVTFDRNVENHFNETESSFFNPGNLVPGIEASVFDRVFTGRVFTYPQDQLFRLGANRSMIPVNRPHGLTGPPKTYSNQGLMNYSVDQGGQPIYYPNNFGGPKDQAHTGGQGQVKNENSQDPDSEEPEAEPENQRSHRDPKDSTTEFSEVIEGTLDYHDLRDDDNFSQPRIFYEKVLNDGEKARLAYNLAEYLYDAVPSVQKRTVNLWGQVSPHLGAALQKALDNKK